MARKAKEENLSEAIWARRNTSYREHSQLLYMMHELSRLISTRVDKGMAAHRLTHAQWWGLMHIFEHEGATQSELAEILQMGRASTGKLLERLEAKRWIRRRPDSRDNRVRRVFLRAEAEPVFKLMSQESENLFAAFLKGISAAEELRLIAGLRKIKDNAEGEAQLVPPPAPRRARKRA